MEIEKNEQTPKQIVERVLNYKKEYEEATKDQRQEIADIYSAYMGKMDQVKKVPYKSQETVPKLRTEVAYVKPFIFSGEPEIEIEGVGEEDKAMAKVLEKIVNYRLSQSIPNAFGKIEDWVHQGVTFGTSIIRPVWVFEVAEKEEDYEEETPEGEIKHEKREVKTVVRDEPDLIVPNILDVYGNPLIAEVEDQHCMIFRSVLPLESVKENPMYDFEENGQLNREKLEGNTNATVSQYDSSNLTKTDIPNSVGKIGGMIEIFELVDKERIQTVACGKENLVIRDKKHNMGFINAVKFVFEKNTIPNRFDGLGVGQNTLGLGKMLYQMFNQSLDKVKLSNNPMFMFAKGSGIDTRQLVAKPGGGISVDTRGGALSNAIQPVVFPDLNQGAVEMMTKMEDEHKRASGANDLIQGSASNSTLGQDQIAQANISNRFELIQRRFKHALAQVAEMLINLEIQNLQDMNAPILRIFPENMRQTIFELITQDAKNVKYNIKVKGDTTVMKNKALESKRLVDLFDLSQNFLTDKEKRAFVRRIAERQGEQNIDELIGEVNPQMEMQEQMAQMQNGMMPQEGQMPQGEFNQVGESPYVAQTAGLA